MRTGVDPFKGMPMKPSESDDSRVSSTTAPTEDHVVRALACGGSVRALAVQTTHLAQALANAHEASPLGAVALSRVGTAALLLGGLLKGREQVGLQFKGDGPLGAVYAVANSRGDVRVSIDGAQAVLPLPEDGRWPMPEAFGQGMLTVTRSLGLKEPYVGVVPLVWGEVAEDLAHYFLASEQKPAAVGVSEVVGPDGLRLAGGFLIQGLPGAEEEVLAEIERRVQGLPPLSTLFAEGVGPEAVLSRIFDELVVLERYPVQFQCNCERARFESLLASLGPAELRHLAEEKDAAEVICHFCNTRYFFRREELLALAEAGGPQVER